MVNQKISRNGYATQNQKNGREVAAQYLGICGVPANLGALVRHLRVKVIKMDMPEEVSGMVLPDPGMNQFLVAVNLSKSYYHRRFTIAHELYHIICNKKDIAFRIVLDFSYKGDVVEEREANIFAVELLMPAESVRKLYAEGCRSVEQYCKFFKVSKSAMEIRLFRELVLAGFPASKYQPIEKMP